MLLVGQQEGHLARKKIEWWDAGMVMSLDQGADLHMAKLMPLLSKNMMSDFAPEIAKYPKSSLFWKCASLLFCSISNAACFSYPADKTKK